MRSASRTPIPTTMIRNHDLVAEAGGNCAVININSVGYGGLAYLRQRSRLVLHAHRNGWDILTRHPGLGMDFRVWQQFWRLLGVDQFQINGIGVKYWEPDEFFVRSFEAITTPLFSPDDCPLPVVGSGQWGGQAPETFRGPDARTIFSTSAAAVSSVIPAGPRPGFGPCARPGRRRWRNPFRDYARGASRTRAIDREVRFGTGRRMTALVHADIRAD